MRSTQSDRGTRDVDRDIGGPFIQWMLRKDGAAACRGTTRETWTVLET